MQETNAPQTPIPQIEITEPLPVIPSFQADTAVAYFNDTNIIEGSIIVESDNFSILEKPDHPLVWVVVGFFCVLLPVASLIFQLLLIYITPHATVTLLPKEQTISIQTQEKINARVLPAFSLSQSKTAATTGRGHQDATDATGAITFYNGAFTSQFLPAGTILTGVDGVQIITEQQAYLPKATPPSFAEVAVLARSVQYGRSDNIPSYDINTSLTASIFAKNTGSFTGGEDARDFSTVTNKDISKLSADLTTSLTRSMSAALQAQLKPMETLYQFPCHKTNAPDHPSGTEAMQVKVTFSETCGGLAYDKQGLSTRATKLLTDKELSQLGAGYHLLQPTITTITNVTMQNNSITLTLFCQAISIYQFSRLQQTQIKQEIAGKSMDEALRLLLHSAGIQTAFIDGVDKAAALPRNTNSIAITVLHPLS